MKPLHLAVIGIGALLLLKSKSAEAKTGSGVASVLYPNPIQGVFTPDVVVPVVQTIDAATLIPAQAAFGNGERGAPPAQGAYTMGETEWKWTEPKNAAGQTASQYDAWKQVMIDSGLGKVLNLI